MRIVKSESNSQFLSVMYDQTEWPGQPIPYEDLHFISDRYERVLKLCENSDVLEIGAGSTIGKKELSRLTSSYISVDISTENISRSKEFCAEHKLYQCEADAHRLPFKPASFDVIVALAMVYYLDAEMFLKEVKAVLRPGGVLFFCTSNKDVPGFVPAPESRQYFSVGEWQELLERESFEVKFEGAFERSHFLPLGFRASLIRMVKRMLARAGLLSLWYLIRSFAKGPVSIIPDQLSDFPAYDSCRVQLDAREENSIHRVIYCECRLVTGS